MSGFPLRNLKVLIIQKGKLYFHLLLVSQETATPQKMTSNYPSREVHCILPSSQLSEYRIVIERPIIFIIINIPIETQHKYVLTEIPLWKGVNRGMQIRGSVPFFIKSETMPHGLYVSFSSPYRTVTRHKEGAVA